MGIFGPKMCGMCKQQPGIWPVRVASGKTVNACTKCKNMMGGKHRPR